ncbi:hypothetical protein AA12467_2090 [Gluconobacter sphaericus NBRC 12467]|nr:hypothetical protein AA12467_2090 [Gluconobacter sphaericus NBRC 12467]
MQALFDWASAYVALDGWFLPDVQRFQASGLHNHVLLALPTLLPEWPFPVRDRVVVSVSEVSWLSIKMHIESYCALL